MLHKERQGSIVRFIKQSILHGVDVNEFMKKKNYQLNSFRPLSPYPELFNINSIPRTFLISRDGEIVIDKKGAANWNSAKIHDQLDLLLSE